MQRTLEKAWNEVGAFFKEHKINSERALQAVLYHTLINRLDNGYRVLIEPEIKLGTGKSNPDIVIIDSTSVKCIMEIKCSPHNVFGNKRIAKDLKKLDMYKNMEDNTFYLDEYGEKRVFNRNNKTWNPETKAQKYDINNSTVYCFAVLGLNDDVKLIEAINKVYNNDNMCILLGLITPCVDKNVNKMDFKVVKEMIFT